MLHRTTNRDATLIRPKRERPIRYLDLRHYTIHYAAQMLA
jgi:hypothetical protein